MEEFYRPIRQELIRSLRGKYSQERISLKMGFKSNPIHKWETMETSPSWNQFVDFCEACRRDIPKAVFYILGFSGDLRASGALIQHLVGSLGVTEISRRTGYSRFVVSKWLSGKSQPSLDVILRLLAEFQFILIEFIDVMTSTENMSTLRDIAEKLRKQKQCVYENPELEGILCALAMQEYTSLKNHDDKIVAKYLGIPSHSISMNLKKLLEVGLVEVKDNKYFVKTTQIDTQGSFDGSIQIRKYWGQKYLKFLDQMRPPEGKEKSAYFVIDLSEEGEQKALEAYHEFCFKLRAIAQKDQKPKKVVKFCAAQLINFGAKKIG